jgi:hypothetical protein
MNKQTPFSGWIANLSNGETVAEGSSELGKPTPWRQLLERLEKDNELKMTGLRLQHLGLNVHALTPRQCDGYFHAYEIHRIMYQKVERNLQGVGSVVDDEVYITWFDKATGNIHQDVRPLEEVKIHVTLG